MTMTPERIREIERDFAKTATDAIEKGKEIIDLYKRECQELKSQITVYRQALERAEWTDVYHPGKSCFISMCPVCRNQKEEGHKENCLVEKALHENHPSSKE